MLKRIFLLTRENAKKSASNEATPTYPALKQMVRELDRMVAATAQVINTFVHILKWHKVMIVTLWF